MTPSSRITCHSPLIGIAGWKNTGKTTLVTRLVSEFSVRGLNVATIKHAHHTFQIDDGETDSARHRRAGAGQVAVVSPTRWAVVHELKAAPEPSLEEIIAQLRPCDLIIVEGYKRAPFAKIEVRRSAAADQRPLSESDPHVVAIASDYAVTDGTSPIFNVPVFNLDDIAGIADFVQARRY